MLIYYVQYINIYITMVRFLDCTHYARSTRNDIYNAVISTEVERSLAIIHTVEISPLQTLRVFQSK